MSSQDEILVSEQVLQVPFNYSAGPVASRFLTALRDERKILGLKCQKCGKVHVPPRAVCGSCFVKMEEWVEVGPRGTLENFTTVHYSAPVVCERPDARPFTIGLIRLEGADTAFAHLALAPERELKIGMELMPVWSDERRGHILDLRGFAPVGA